MRDMARRVDELSEVERECLRLRLGHGWTEEQIAKHLKLTPGAVRSILGKALQRIARP